MRFLVVLIFVPSISWANNLFLVKNLSTKSPGAELNEKIQSAQITLGEHKKQIEQLQNTQQDLAKQVAKAQAQFSAVQAKNQNASVTYKNTTQKLQASKQQIQNIEKNLLALDAQIQKENQQVFWAKRTQGLEQDQMQRIASELRQTKAWIRKLKHQLDKQRIKSNNLHKQNMLLQTNAAGLSTHGTS